MSLEKAEELLGEAIQEVEKSGEYRDNNNRRNYLKTTIRNIESATESLWVDPDAIKNKIADAIQQHTDETIDININFSHDSIYPYAQITCIDLTLKELMDLSRIVTRDVYSEEFPVVVII